MSDQSEALQSIADVVPTTRTEMSAKDKRRRWLEIFLILGLTLGNSFVASLFVLKNTPNETMKFTTQQSLYGIVHESMSILLLIYILSRRGLRLRDLGLRWSIRDIGIGFLLTVVAGFAYSLGAFLLQELYYGFYRTAPVVHDARQFFAHPSLVALPLMILNPFFEELIVRAYLMSEISDLTGSTLLALTVSILVQTSYHLYYGWMGALSLAFMFLVFAIYYARSKRILPVIVAHAVFDLSSFIRLL